MIITNIQLPNGIVDSKGSKGAQNQENFLSTLTHALETNTKEIGEVKLDNLVLDGEVLKDEDESINDIASQLSVLFNFTLYDREVKNEEEAIMGVSNDLIVENFDFGKHIPLNNVESLSESQMEILARKQDSNIIKDTITDFKEVDLMESETTFGLKHLPHNQDFRQLKEQYHIDRNINLDNEKEPKKDSSINEVNRGTVSEVKDHDIRLKSYEVKANNATMFNNFVQENQPIINDPEVLKEGQSLPKENIQGISKTILKLVETTTEGETSVMRVKLYPEDLGTVNVVLKMDKGKVSTKILVDNDQIKQLFASKVEEISENLVKLNISMDKVEIELNQNQSFNFNSSSDSRENFNRNNGQQLKQQNQFLNFEREESRQNVLSDRYDSLSSISILA